MTQEAERIRREGQVESADILVQQTERMRRQIEYHLGTTAYCSAAFARMKRRPVPGSDWQLFVIWLNYMTDPCRLKTQLCVD